jgi:hypothetical protein
MTRIRLLLSATHMSDAPPQNQPNRTEPPRRRRWLGLPVIQPVEDSLAAILRQLPQFGRQPFTMTSVNGSEVGVNPYLDMVYRVPARQGEGPVPVGVVSKNYRLVDHHHVLRTIDEVLADLGIESARLKVRGEWTVNGERARFSLIFPSDDRFSVKLGDRDEMRFRIEIFNSVDGSCRLMAVAGWLRFVCYNGLILGKALMQIRQQHRQQLQIEELGRLFREALQTADEDQRTMAKWRSRQTEPDALLEWVDADVFDKWGLKGAVRVLGISRSGWDAEPKGDLKNKRPSDVATEQTIQVPGIDPPIETAFGVSQALTWVAGQRTELQEDLEWRSQVPELMALLLKRSPSGGSLFA